MTTAFGSHFEGGRHFGYISGETWQGKWQGNEIAAKILALRECTPRISRDFNDEYPKLRIFSHPNVMPVIGCCNSPPNLVVISQFVPLGSLYQVLHEGSGLVVDAAKAIQFAIDIAKGMSFLHSLDRTLPRFYLNSRHIMVSPNLYNNGLSVCLSPPQKCPPL